MKASAQERWDWIAQRPSVVIALLVLTVAVIVGVAEGVSALVRSSSATASALGHNPNLDPGTAIHRPASNFTLTDQFGRRVLLSSYRGKVVLLAFADSRCTTVCPLTTTTMLQAKRMLGAAGSRVALLGIDANPEATKVADVRAYSVVHQMMNRWRFLTAPPPELKRVWRNYGIAAQVLHGQIDHTPGLFVIDQKGWLRRVYLTQMNYASVGQAAQLIAREAARLLPGHPQVHARLSYRTIAGIRPSTPVRLPRAGGGSVALGPGSPRLYLFFATWDSEITDLGRQLETLGSDQRRSGLPPLTAVDEGTVEPSASALPHFLGALPKPLSYPVAIDRSGRVADGYGVQDEPWFVLVSSSGQILWYYDVSTSGWLPRAALVSKVHAALRKVPALSAGTSALSGSPPPLGALHRQAGQLLGGALISRIHQLHGYPIVVNAWASWCVPCQKEFALFASASQRFGRKVAFLGADTEDSSGAAQSFLAKHRVSYPSYQTSVSDLGSLVSIAGLPTTVFISATGKVLYAHSGQYVSQGTLDQDIESYALR